MMRHLKNNTFLAVVCLIVPASVCALASLGRDTGPTRDHGWVSPWLAWKSPQRAKWAVAQEQVKHTGGMAVALSHGAALSRNFPDVRSGILQIDLHIRFAYVASTIYGGKSSGIKVYVGDKDKGHSFAWRWHAPAAWPEIGGNTIPRFYVMDRSGRKRKGLEYTNFMVVPYQWHKVTTVTDLDDHTWQFWVDGVKFDTQMDLGRAEMATRRTEKLNTIFMSTSGSTIWLDGLRVWHNNRLIAACDVDVQDGYVADRSIVGLPARR